MTNRQMTLELLERSLADNQKFNDNIIENLEAYNAELVEMLKELTGNDYSDKIKAMSSWTREAIKDTKKVIDLDLDAFANRAIRSALKADELKRLKK